MKTIWYIAKKDLLENLKDKGTVMLLLAVPLVLITVIGFAFGSLFGSSSSQITITVAVSNQDSGSIGASIVDALKIDTRQLKITVNEYQDAQRVTEQVADNSNVNAGIVIPAGTSDRVSSAIKRGTMPHNFVQFYALPSNTDPRATIVQNIVSNTVIHSWQVFLLWDRSTPCVARKEIIALRRRSIHKQ